MTQLMITLNKIQENMPSTILWDCLTKDKDVEDGDKPFPLSSLLDTNTLDETFWVCSFLTEHKSLFKKLGWWYATTIIHKTDDKRVHHHLDTVRDYVFGNLPESKVNDACKDLWGIVTETALKEECDSRILAGIAEIVAWSGNTHEASTVWSVSDAIRFIQGVDADGTAEEMHTKKLREVLDTGELTH